MGSLEARGVAEGDWTTFWQAVIVDLFSGGTARGHSSCAAAPLKAGIDAVGAMIKPADWALLPRTTTPLAVLVAETVHQRLVLADRWVVIACILGSSES